MNDATLTHFRNIADAMRGNEPADWQWIGQYPRGAHGRRV
jgi:hypothetical protein